MSKSYIELYVVRTSRPAGPNERWERFDSFKKTFPTLAAAKVWMKDHYGKCSKQKMYQDGASGKTMHTGWVFKWREKRSVQGDYGTYYMQDWVSVRSMRMSNPLTSVHKKNVRQSMHKRKGRFVLKGEK